MAKPLLLLWVTIVGLIEARNIDCNTALKIYFDFARDSFQWHRCSVVVIGFITVASFQGLNPSVYENDPKDHWVSFCHLQFQYDGANLVANYQNCFFSDRMHEVGGFQYPFSPYNTDKHSYILTPSGQLTTTLNSWGNATVTQQLTCTSGGIHNFGTDLNELIMLKKSCSPIPR